MKRIGAVLLVLTLTLLTSGERQPPTNAGPPPPGMVLVAAGPFWMGSNDKDADEDSRPLRQISLPAFYIDRTEVTNADFAKVFPDHGFAPGHGSDPVTHVTRAQAEAYLRTLGKRLPTSAEWEKAARGTDGRRYPWGNQYDSSRAHAGRALTHSTNSCALARMKPVGSFPLGASPYGCLDMAGNAWEWVADDYPSRPPRQIIRGGAYGYAERWLRTYAFAIEETGIT